MPVVTVITKAADFTAKFPTSLHGTRVGKETWWWGEGERGRLLEPAC